MFIELQSHLTRLAPLFILYILLHKHHFDSFLLFITYEFVEICIRSIVNQDNLTGLQLLNEFGLKLVSPRIFLPILDPQYNHYSLIFLECATFFALKKESRDFSSVTIFICLYLLVVGELDILSFSVLLISLGSSYLRLLFPNYEIYCLQSVICLIVGDIQRNSKLVTDPYAPRNVLFLAEIALLSLYFMIAMSAFVNVFFDFISQGMKFTIFLFIMLLQISLFIWPMYLLILGTNPFFWFLNLFFINDYLGSYFSLFWILLITGTIWFALKISEKQYQISKIIRRKIFHFLVIIMFLPLLITNVIAFSFLIYALAGAFAIFILSEYLRNYLLAKEMAFIQGYFHHFILDKEIQRQSINSNQYLITSHISLLIAVASSIWFYALLLTEADGESSSLQATYGLNPQRDLPLIPYFGLITVGFGDAMAAIFGSLYGRLRWPSSNKTVFGSIIAFISMVLKAALIQYFLIGQQEIEWIILILTFFFTALAEVFIDGNDNLFLPIFSMVMYIGFKYNLA